MDVMMPELDGLDTMRIIGSSTPNREIPIIAVTAKAMMGDRDKWPRGRRDDYVRSRSTSTSCSRRLAAHRCRSTQPMNEPRSVETLAGPCRATS